jgi:nicotinic acid mononucleotide adenylyltransferase
MGLLQELNEGTKNILTVVYCFGSFTPPTQGHKKLFDRVMSVKASGNVVRIIAPSSKARDGAFPADKKRAIIRKMFSNRIKEISTVRDIDAGRYILDTADYVNAFTIAEDIVDSSTMFDKIKFVYVHGTDQTGLASGIKRHFEKDERVDVEVQLSVVPRDEGKQHEVVAQIQDLPLEGVLQVVSKVHQEDLLKGTIARILADLIMDEQDPEIKDRGIEQLNRIVFGVKGGDIEPYVRYFR